MKSLDLDKFFREAPLGKVNAAQSSNLRSILLECEKQYKPSERTDKALRQIAYIIATEAHETNMQHRPVKEAYWLTPEERRVQYLINYYSIGKGKNHKAQIIVFRNNKRYLYYGRGYVQITLLDNYKWADEVTNNQFNFVEFPEKVLDPEISKFILIEWFYRLHKTRFNSFTAINSWNLRELRRIVNRTDAWETIGAIAVKVYNSLNWVDAPNNQIPMSIINKMRFDIFNLKAKLNLHF